jgi:hypothetical protein
MANQGFNAFVLASAASAAFTGAESLPVTQGGATTQGNLGTLQSFGSLITFAAASGSVNNANPGGGWPLALGRVRLNVDTTAGNAEWTGLLAAADGQEVLITNTGANTLQLDNANASSSAANRFKAVGNLVLVPNGRTLAIYYGGSLNLWFIG